MVSERLALVAVPMATVPRQETEMKTLLPILWAGALTLLLAACDTDGIYSGGSVGRLQGHAHSCQNPLNESETGR